MISMSITSNSNATNNIYATNKSRLLEREHDSGLYRKNNLTSQEFSKTNAQQVTTNTFIGNSLFTRITNTLPSINGTSNDKICNLINVYDVIQPPAESNDTKECHVVMPKLNKSLDIHLNKTKTINLKRLQHLVAKNIVKKDSVSLDAETTTKGTSSQIGANCNEKNDSETQEEKMFDCDQRRDVCKDVLYDILDRVSADKVCGETFVRDLDVQTTTLEEDQSHIHSLVDKIVNELSNKSKSKRKLEKSETVKEQVEMSDICSQSSDYASLKLSLDNESEHEENARTVDLCAELTGNQTESKHTLVLEWLDTDRLPTPSPPPPITAEPTQIESTKSSENVEQVQTNTNSSVLERIDEPEKADCNDAFSGLLENGSEAGTSTDKISNDEQKLKPIKLYLKDIQKANSEKMLVKVTKKFHRLTLTEGQIMSCSQQMSQSEGEIEVHTPKIVMFATVDNNCIIENVNFSDSDEKHPSEESQHKSNAEIASNTTESNVEMEKSGKSEQLSFDVLQSKVDEMSKKLQFDLEDTISFMKSTVTLLKDEKWNIKRKRSGHMCKKFKRKQSKEESKETKKSTSPNLTLDHKSSDSNAEDPSDEEFCPTDCQTSNDITNTIQTRSQISTPKSDGDTTLTYKRKLRKRQSINFLEDTYSDDFDSDAPSPIESKKQKSKKTKASKKDNSEIQNDKKEANDPETDKGKTECLDIDGQVARIVATVIAPQANTAICSIKQTSQTSINTSSTAMKLSTIIELTKEKCGQADKVSSKSAIDEAKKSLCENNNSSIIKDSQLVVDAPLDLSKKVLVEATSKAEAIETSRKGPDSPEKNISDPKRREAKEIETVAIDDDSKSEEEMKQQEKTQDNQVHTLEQLKAAIHFRPTMSQMDAFSFPNYNAELFQTEYQRLQKELAALDYVAEQKQRERNNILQLKKHRLIAMQQLQLRKQLLSQVQRPNNPPVSSAAAAPSTTTVASLVHLREPFMMSAANSVLYSNQNYQMLVPAARLSTSTEVTPARPNGVIVRPIVTKPVVTNAQVLPIRPQIKPVYNPKAIIPANWPPNRLAKSNADYWHHINTVQTVVAKSGENWLNDRRIASYSSITTATAAQTPFVNREIIPINPGGKSQNKESDTNSSNTNAVSKVPVSYQHSTLAQLLTSNQV